MSVDKKGLNLCFAFQGFKRVHPENPNPNQCASTSLNNNFRRLIADVGNLCSSKTGHSLKQLCDVFICDLIVHMNIYTHIYVNSVTTDFNKGIISQIIDFSNIQF